MLGEPSEKEMPMLDEYAPIRPVEVPYANNEHGRCFFCGTHLQHGDCCAACAAGDI